MTNKQIIEMLKAELMCITLSTSYDYNAHCYENCDNCEYAYAKGTYGERKEMLQSVIRQLEIIEQIKSMEV